MTPRLDDGIVVEGLEMSEKRLTIAEYFEGPESLRPMELVHSVVREPPAPLYGHQSIVTRAIVLLDVHVRALGLGAVCVSPIDVVLDEESALVVQPDVVFVSAARAGIIHDRIWGAPDLVIEVLSPRTAVHDAIEKLAWYRQYGVQECWFVSPQARTIEVVDCRPAPGGDSHTFAGHAIVQSSVLPSLSIHAEEFFR